MAYNINQLMNEKQTSIHGRRLALDRRNFLLSFGMRVPIEDFNTTLPSTASLYGVTRMSGLTSTQGPVQHNLPAPVPGMRKTLILDCTSTASIQFLSTPNGAAIIISSLGTTGGVVNFVGPAGRITLLGISSTIWSVESEGGYSSTAFGKPVTFTTST